VRVRGPDRPVPFVPTADSGNRAPRPFGRGRMTA
jgi:hypothetical protein